MLKNIGDLLGNEDVPFVICSIFESCWGTVSELEDPLIRVPIA
ncbi:hypothetical protein [Halomontanus rarus]